MKKIIAYLLSLMLCVGTAMPAVAAADPMQEELSAITLAVKSRIPDTSAFTHFDGRLEEYAGCRYWNLRWEDDAGSALSVSAAGDGHILSYSYYPASANEMVSSFQGYVPQIEQWDEAEILKAAKEFVDGVMLEGESCALEMVQQPGVARYQTTRCRLRGQLSVQGVPTSLWVSVTVEPHTLTVLDYSCGEMQDGLMAELPSAQPAVQSEKARTLLDATLQLKAEYVTLSGDAQQTAVLRYLPVYTHDYLVDAHTGELLDLTEREQLFSAPSAGGDMAEDSNSAEKGELSEAEQAGILALAGVLNQEQLNQKLQAVQPLGLGGYALSQAEYAAKEEGAQVTARLLYEAGEGEQKVSKTLLVDARTAEILSLYTMRRESGSPSAGKVDAKAAAQAFVQAYWPEQAAQCGVYERPTAAAAPLEQGRYQGVTLAQQQDGYFYADNYFNVGINTQDGTVEWLDWNYDETVKLVKPEQVIAPEQAMQAYQACFEVQLLYQMLLRQDAQERLHNQGGCPYELRLGYALQQTQSIQAIDAATGAYIAYPEREGGIAYTDAEGWQGAQQLLHYGIGYPGSRLDGSAPVTQRDMLALLLSADGYYYAEDSGQDGLDALYERAQWSGILQAGQRDPEHLMTRAEAVVLLVSMSGYGRTASLADIYVCRFGDAASIPREYYGYVATAQGMGIVTGDAQGNFRPNDVVTRGEAAQMFYAFLRRQLA